MTLHLQLHHISFCKAFQYSDLSLGEKPFMCSYCEKTFRTREGLKDHEDIIHTKVGLKHCAACGEEFTTNRGLKSHMNLKHGVEERFQCKFCGFYFLSVEGHRAHEETAPCKANTCDICGRMYFQKKDLVKHLKGHVTKSKKAFHCKMCSKAFTRESNLNAHVRKMHFNQEEVLKAAQQYICNFCGKTFSTSTTFLSHVETHRTILSHPT